MGRDGRESVANFDLKTELDAFVTARSLDVLGFQLQPVRQSLVSIAEVEARQFIPSPGLADFRRQIDGQMGCCKLSEQVVT